MNLLPTNVNILHLLLPLLTGCIDMFELIDIDEDGRICFNSAFDLLKRSNVPRVSSSFPVNMVLIIIKGHSNSSLGKCMRT
jgi:Ca2+-binding EF-hand superfamily protein